MTRRALALALLLSLPAVTFAQAPQQGHGAEADFVAPGAAVPLPPALAAAVDRLRASDVMAHIAFLAAPGFEGRGLGKPGVELAAEYAATTLALAGIAPAREATGLRSAYFQALPIREIAHARGELTVERTLGEGRASRTFSSGVDCLFPDVAPQTLAGPVVFAGYGIREPALGRDDFRGLDPKDKILVVIGGLPPGDAWTKPELVARYGAGRGRERYAAKLEAARSLGARAVLAVEPEFGQVLAEAPPVTAPYFLPADAVTDGPPLVIVSPAVASALLASSPAEKGAPDYETARGATGMAVTIRLTGDERRLVGRNVVAVIPGSDPRLKEEAVVIGAHLDHLGRTGDRVYPGADDNASGVAALLEIAKAYGASTRRPRRTIVFAFWTGEEEGHLGSDYYVRHPVWPLERTAVYANLDMIAHPWLPDEIKKLVADTRLPGGAEFLSRVKPADFIEPGVAEWAPELCQPLTDAARGLGLALHFDRTDGRNGGSDYRAFARKGIRFIRFFGNYFPGYHEPSDTPDSLDPAQVLKMTRLALATTWLLADR